MRIAVISDTHNFLDPRIPALFAGVDHILHGGDIGMPIILLELEQIAPVVGRKLPRGTVRTWMTGTVRGRSNPMPREWHQLMMLRHDAMARGFTDLAITYGWSAMRVGADQIAKLVKSKTDAP